MCSSDLAFELNIVGNITDLHYSLLILNIRKNKRSSNTNILVAAYRVHGEQIWNKLVQK